MFSIRCQHLFRSLYNLHATLFPSPNGSAHNQRAIFTTGILHTDYYEALGIPVKSTQNEIKAAYYKLSMIYHPDKNQGSESAAKKFREITQAYEVLSNYRLRRLYDKGIIHPAGSPHAQSNNVQHNVDVEEDDAQTKFYKSRFTRSKVANPKGGTPIYNFDEWAKAHYGDSLNRKMNARARFDRKEAAKKDGVISFQNEVVIYALVIGTILVFVVSSMDSSYDNPRNKGKEK